MLEKINLEKEVSQKEIFKMMDELGPKLSALQRECHDLGIPIMIVFEGWGASGKGTLINRLIEPLDPRGFRVYTTMKPTKEEELRPFLWRFFTKIPAKGSIHIFDRSWYQRVIVDRTMNCIGKKDLELAYHAITNFEEQLTKDGMLIIKFFLHISKKEQKKRFNQLEATSETSWRVTKRDWRNHEHYEEILQIFDEMLVRTDKVFAPWTVIEATNREYAALKIISTTVERLSKAIEIKKNRKKSKEEVKDSNTLLQIKGVFTPNVLEGINLDKELGKDEYRNKLKPLQEKLALLHSAMYKERLPVVLVFEGWDAAGKGGAIKRLTGALDPRGYAVVPIKAPNDIEKAHHYLWRFWNEIPKAGHLTIFDRSWYGRVMVERIEGFCTEEEWERAYSEINQMEEHLTNAGYIVIKFWLHIDKEEQERRFKQRQDNPEKRWKITEEDWRNREKWDQYEEAVDEMIIRTSTNNAPWVIVEANSKYYARIKVLETVIDTISKRLDKVY